MFLVSSSGTSGGVADEVDEVRGGGDDVECDGWMIGAMLTSRKPGSNSSTSSSGKVGCVAGGGGPARQGRSPGKVTANGLRKKLFGKSSSPAANGPSSRQELSCRKESY